MKRSLLVIVVAALTLPSCASTHDEHPPATNGVAGQVLIGPACPVASPRSPCPDKPVQGVVTALKRIGQAVASVHTDANGRFSLTLRPGVYLMFARQLGDNPRISKFERVTVVAGRSITLTLLIDTGIR